MDDVLSAEFLETLVPYMKQIQVVTNEEYQSLSRDDPSFEAQCKLSWDVLDELGYAVFSEMERFPGREWPATIRLLEEFRPACWKLCVVIPANEIHNDLWALLAQCYSLARRLQQRALA